MGLFVNQQNKRSDLQERIAADLKEKAARAKMLEDGEVDGVDDSRYIEGTKKTTTLAWAWMLIVLMAVGVVILFLI